MTEINDPEILKLRGQLNQIDNQLLHLLEARFENVKEIGEIKKQKGLPIRDKEREEEVIKTKCGKTSLDDGFVGRFFRFLIDESVKLEGGK